PPTLKKDVPRLRAFLRLLPSQRRVAFEFRHPSWFDDEVLRLLREHRVTRCIANADDDLEALGSDKFLESLSLVFHQVLGATIEIRERVLAQVDPKVVVQSCVQFAESDWSGNGFPRDPIGRADRLAGLHAAARQQGAVDL